MNDKLQTIITQVEQLSVLELAELVKAMEEKFGVSAAAPAMMMAAPGAAAGAPAEEKTEFAVGEKATFDDKSITVTEVQRNYDTGNQFSQPESGKEFVIVTVNITNDGEGTLDYNTFNFKLQDSNGVQQNEAFSALSEGKLNSGSLAAGGKVTGKLAYEVPKDDAGLKLLYQDFSFFDNKAITFKLQ